MYFLFDPSLFGYGKLPVVPIVKTLTKHDLRKLKKKLKNMTSKYATMLVKL